MPWGNIEISLSLQLWIKSYNYFSSSSIALTSNNPRGLICNETKNPPPKKKIEMCISQLGVPIVLTREDIISYEISWLNSFLHKKEPLEILLLLIEETSLVFFFCLSFPYCYFSFCFCLLFFSFCFDLKKGSDRKRDTERERESVAPRWNKTYWFSFYTFKWKRVVLSVFRRVASQRRRFVVLFCLWKTFKWSSI